LSFFSPNCRLFFYKLSFSPKIVVFSKNCRFLQNCRFLVTPLLSFWQKYVDMCTDILEEPIALATWVNGGLYECIAEFECACSDPDMQTLGTFFKYSIVSASTQWMTPGQTKLVLIGCEKGAMYVWTPLRWAVVRASIEYSDGVYTLKLNRESTTRFRLTPKADWASCSNYAKTTSLLSNAYSSLCTFVGSSAVQSNLPGVVSWICRTYLSHIPPKRWLTYTHGSNHVWFMFEFEGDESLSPKEIRAPLARMMRLGMIHFETCAGERLDIDATCFTKRKIRYQPVLNIQKMYTEVYPALRVGQTKWHVGCSKCDQSIVKPIRHRKLLRCNKCDATFVYNIRAKEHYDQVHTVS